MSRGTQIVVASAAAVVALSWAATAPGRTERQAHAGRAADVPACCTVLLTLPTTYSAILTTKLAPPAGYTPTAAGAWSGPQFRLNKPGAASRPSTMKWWVKVDHASTTAEAAVRAFTIDPAVFTLVKTSGSIEVPHVVSGHRVGTIVGYSALLQSSQVTLNAEYEGVLAFPLAAVSPVSKSASRAPYFVVVRFLTREPASDRYVMTATPTLASAWNAQQIAAAFTTVEVVGSMPPSQYTATVSRVSWICCRAVVRGRVTDSLGHPVAGARVTLLRDLPQTAAQRRRHSKVKSVVVTATQSAEDGTYVVRVARHTPPGPYHLQAQLANSLVGRAIDLAPRS